MIYVLIILLCLINITSYYSLLVTKGKGDEIVRKQQFAKLNLTHQRTRGRSNIKYKKAEESKAHGNLIIEEPESTPVNGRPKSCWENFFCLY